MVATKLLCPWSSPGNTGVGCHSLLQGIFPDIPPKSWQNLTLLSLTCTVLGSYWAQMTCTIALVAQMVKRLPAMWETWVKFLGQEDPLEKEMATTPVLLPGKSHEWKSLVVYSPWGCKESDTTERLHFSGSITTNKASGADRIPTELFQILKDNAVKVLHSICQQIWNNQQ